MDSGWISGGILVHSVVLVSRDGLFLRLELGIFGSRRIYSRLWVSFIKLTSRSSFIRNLTAGEDGRDGQS